MHSVIYLILAIFFTVSFRLTAQQSKSVNWLDNNHARFVENVGQFQLEGSEGISVLYAIDEGHLKVCFTQDGLVYCLRKSEHEQEYEQETPGKENRREVHEKREHVKTITQTIRVKWLHCNRNVQVIPLDLAQDYYSYIIKVDGVDKNINHIKAYKKLLYKNIYPKIDLEYTIHPTKGFKYNFILHPGANPAHIQMKIEGSSIPVMDKEGNLIYYTILGEITDHAPKTYYHYQPSVTIRSGFKKIDEATFGFHLDPYNPMETVVIDPWTVMGIAAPPVGRVRTDNSGNVYAYNSSFLRKYNSSGVLQWTLGGINSYNEITNLAVNPNTGTSYIALCCCTIDVRAISTTGTVIWTHTVSTWGYEYWYFSFNCDYTELVWGGAFYNSGWTACVGRHNATTGASLGIVTAPALSTFGSGHKEIRAICATPGNRVAYMTLYGDNTLGEFNFGSMSTTYATAWLGYTFPYGTFHSSTSMTYYYGLNLMVSDGTYLYTRNENTLHQRSLTSGVILASVALPGSGSCTMGTCMGIDADDACNVYVGSGNGVYKYNSSLTLVASATTPSAVLDVAINPFSNEVIACGDGFITSLAIPTSGRVVLSPCGGPSCAVLPVQLRNFNAQCLPNDHVVIQWTTQIEEDNEKFVLERGFVAQGTNQVSWEAIATIKGAGNSTFPQQYQFVDKTVKTGISYYYRLKQVSKDGQSKYSAPVQVQCFDVGESTFVYPTISEGSFTVQYTSLSASAIEVFDMKGQKVYDKLPKNTQDKVVETLNLGHLAKGMYLIVARTQEKIYSQKVIIK